MADVQAVINRALRLIGVKDFSESASSEEMDNGIQALNQMMARWETDGISVGWSAVAGVAETVPVPDEALEAVQYSLAVKLSPEYPGAVVSPIVIKMAENGYNDLLRDSMANTIQPTQLDLPASGGSYNINSDTY